MDWLIAFAVVVVLYGVAMVALYYLVKVATLGYCSGRRLFKKLEDDRNERKRSR